MSQVVANDLHRTTVDLPRSLLQRAQRLIDSKIVRSRNGLIVAALESYVERLEREAIDAQIAAMATDAKYQQLMLAMADEFASSDWEALDEATHAAR